MRDFWRRKWKPTPVLLPGKSHGWRSLIGYTVRGVAKSWTLLRDFTSLHFTSFHERFGGFPGGAGGKEFTCQCRICKR